IEASAGHLFTTTPALPLHPPDVIVRRAFVELALWSWARACPAGRSRTADVPRGRWRCPGPEPIRTQPRRRRDPALGCLAIDGDGNDESPRRHVRRFRGPW